LIIRRLSEDSQRYEVPTMLDFRYEKEQLINFCDLRIDALQQIAAFVLPRLID
jgi:hypothetical protein